MPLDRPPEGGMAARIFSGFLQGIDRRWTERKNQQREERLLEEQRVYKTEEREAAQQDRIDFERMRQQWLESQKPGLLEKHMTREGELKDYEAKRRIDLKLQQEFGGEGQIDTKAVSSIYPWLETPYASLFIQMAQMQGGGYAGFEQASKYISKIDMLKDLKNPESGIPGKQVGGILNSAGQSPESKFISGAVIKDVLGDFLFNADVAYDDDADYSLKRILGDIVDASPTHIALVTRDNRDRDYMWGRVLEAINAAIVERGAEQVEELKKEPEAFEEWFKKIPATTMGATPAKTPVKKEKFVIPRQGAKRPGG